MLQSKPLVSIIMPIYNVKDYLRKSLDSILEQDYENLDIILVDDGSTDNSGDICDEYQEKDRRVVTVHKKNGGQASARNVGLQHSRGELIAFIDSDDVVSPEYISRMLKVMQEKQCDIVQCGYARVLADDRQVLFGNFSLVTDGLQLQGYLYDKRYNPEPYDVLWNKLYKRELWEGIFFPDGRIHEDYAIAYRVFYKAKKIVVIPDILYYYTIREGSTMRTRNVKSLLDWRQAERERWEFYRKEGLLKLASLSMKSYYYQTLHCVECNNLEVSVRTSCMHECRRLSKEMLRSPDYSLKIKLGIFLVGLKAGVINVRLMFLKNR